MKLELCAVSQWHSRSRSGQQREAARKRQWQSRCRGLRAYKGRASSSSREVHPASRARRANSSERCGTLQMPKMEDKQRRRSIDGLRHAVSPGAARVQLMISRRRTVEGVEDDGVRWLLLLMGVTAKHCLKECLAMFKFPWPTPVVPVYFKVSALTSPHSSPMPPAYLARMRAPHLLHCSGRCTRRYRINFF